MTTLNEKSVWSAGSCMFCTNLNVSVNVIQGNTVEVRICDSCLAEAHLTKRAPDRLAAGGRKHPARAVKQIQKLLAKHGGR